MQELFDKQKEAHERLLYCLDGRHTDITAGNTGDANNWIRHIDFAYEEYRDATDNLQEALNKLTVIQGDK